MRLTDSLSSLFASRGHVAVLRAIWAHRQAPMTGREVARAARLSTAQAARILRSLQDEGIAESCRVGAAFAWSWNDEHVWAAQLGALFSAEARTRDELVESIRVVFRGAEARDVRIYGSFARREERPDSDIDLFVEVEGRRDAQRIRELLGRQTRGIWKRFGNPISPLILTRSELRRLANHPLISRIHEEGISVTAHG